MRKCGCRALLRVVRLQQDLVHGRSGVVPGKGLLGKQAPKDGRVKGGAANDAAARDERAKDLTDNAPDVKERHQVAIDVLVGQVPAQGDGGGGRQHVAELVRDQFLVSRRARSEQDEDFVASLVGLSHVAVVVVVVARQQQALQRHSVLVIKPKGRLVDQQTGHDESKDARLVRTRHQTHKRNVEFLCRLLNRPKDFKVGPTAGTAAFHDLKAVVLAAAAAAVLRQVPRVRSNHQIGAAPLQIGLQLGHGTVGVERHGAGPVGRRHQSQSQFGSVGQDQGDAVRPTHDAQLLQRRSKLVHDKLVDARVRDGGAAVNRGQGGGLAAAAAFLMVEEGRGQRGKERLNGVRHLAADDGTVRLQQVACGGENGSVLLLARLTRWSRSSSSSSSSSRRWRRKPSSSRTCSGRVPSSREATW